MRRPRITAEREGSWLQPRQRQPPTHWPGATACADAITPASRSVPRCSHCRILARVCCGPRWIERLAGSEGWLIYFSLSHRVEEGEEEIRG